MTYSHHNFPSYDQGFIGCRMDNYYDKIRERVLNPKTSLDDINVSQNFNSPPLSPPLSVSGLPAPPSARANDRKIVLVLVQWLGPSLGSFEVKAIDDLLKLKGVGRERSTIAYLPIYCDIPQHLTPNQLKLPGVGSKAHQTSPLLIRHLAQIGRNDITIDYFWKVSLLVYTYSITNIILVRRLGLCSMWSYKLGRT